jgi:antitoxin component YwqK of YwqJK toxin-antitoxin module
MRFLCVLALITTFAACESKDPDSVRAEPGAKGEKCHGNGTCNGSLACVGGFCVPIKKDEVSATANKAKSKETGKNEGMTQSEQSSLKSGGKAVRGSDSDEGVHSSDTKGGPVKVEDLPFAQRLRRKLAKLGSAQVEAGQGSAGLGLKGAGAADVDGASEVPATDRDSLTKLNDLLVHKDTQEPYTGRVWYIDGGNRIECDYTDGKKHGKQTEWFQRGKKREEYSFKNGQRHGKFTRWQENENGYKGDEGHYKNGKMHGIYRSWNKKGQKRGEDHYNDGKQHGKSAAWHEDGKKASEGIYKDGKKHGKWTEWRENGQKRSEYCYNNDKASGCPPE